MAMEQWDNYQRRYPTGAQDHGNINAVINDSIICSIDKDLDQIPGFHYNFLHKVKYWVNEEEALRWFYVQLIAGDSTDNIQGVPGYGEKKAMKALDNCKTEQEMYAKVVELYTDYFKDKQIVMDTIKETAKLVWMVREKGVEWCPPN